MPAVTCHCAGSNPALGTMFYLISFISLFKKGSAMFKKIVSISVVLFFGCSVQAGLESLVKGQSYVVDGALVCEHEALALCQGLPDKSQEAIAALSVFEDAMQYASRLLPYGAGLKKQEALTVWNSLCDFEVDHGCARAVKSCQTSIVAIALAHAKVVRDFCKEEQEELNAVSQIKARSCADVHTIRSQELVVRDLGKSERPTLTRFRESALFLRDLCLLADGVRKLIPEIDTLTRGQLTKKLLSDFTEPCDAEEGKDTI